MNRCHDESEVWCGKIDYFADGEPTMDVGYTDCGACLTMVASVGRAASGRLRDLRPKDWNACPIEAHANDCDCQGSAGDR